MTDNATDDRHHRVVILHEFVGAVAPAEPRRSAAPIIAGMVTLAALDIVGAAFARHWSEHRSTISFAGGILVFSLLFVVYGKSLDYARLSTVTIGWVVILQVGVVVLDRVHGTAIPPNKLAAIAGILALQAYLTLGDLAH